MECGESLAILKINKKIHEGLKIFLWWVLLNSIPTKEALLQKLGIGGRECPVSGCEVELETSFDTVQGA